MLAKSRINVKGNVKKTLNKRPIIQFSTKKQRRKAHIQGEKLNKTSITSIQPPYYKTFMKKDQNQAQVSMKNQRSQVEIEIKISYHNKNSKSHPHITFPTLIFNKNIT